LSECFDDLFSGYHSSSSSHHQKPIALHGHERSITKICYNSDGDLLFSASKDNVPSVWWSVNGERLGTFDGHTGAVWTLDCNCEW